MTDNATTASTAPGTEGDLGQDSWVDEREALRITGLSKAALRNRRNRGNLDAEPIGLRSDGIATGYVYSVRSLNESLSAQPARSPVAGTGPGRPAARTLVSSGTYGPELEASMARAEVNSLELALAESEHARTRAALDVANAKIAELQGELIHWRTLLAQAAMPLAPR